MAKEIINVDNMPSAELNEYAQKCVSTLNSKASSIDVKIPAALGLLAVFGALGSGTALILQSQTGLVNATNTQLDQLIAVTAGLTAFGMMAFITALVTASINKYTENQQSSKLNGVEKVANLAGKINSRVTEQ